MFNKYLLNKCLGSGFLEAEPETGILLQWFIEGELSGETISKWGKQNRKQGKELSKYVISCGCALADPREALECEGHPRIVSWGKRVGFLYPISFCYELWACWEKEEHKKIPDISKQESSVFPASLWEEVQLCEVRHHNSEQSQGGSTVSREGPR